MKKLICSDLGGPCDAEITGETFEELGTASKNHVMDMVMKGDADHMAAVEKMKNASPEEQQALFEGFKNKFEEAPEETTEE